MLNTMYWVWQKAVDPDFCDYVLSKTDWNTSKAAEVNLDEKGIVKPESRITDIVWHNHGAPSTSLLYQHIHMANDMAGWNFDVKYPQEAQIGRYINGGHYKWHVDTFPPDEKNMQRKLSCVLLLNDPSEYEGGELELEDFEEFKLEGKGSIVVFPSFLRHRVTPVTSGVRYTATCWAMGSAFK
jgi:PKHD-type hydroxylase